MSNIHKCQWQLSKVLSEAKYLNEIQTKVLRVFLLVFKVTSTALPCDFYFFKLTQPLTVSNGLRNPYRNLKSENSQDYAQKPQ
jgi:hypothetical protein